MRILLCFGTRPEAIKMAPICNELKNSNIEFKVCVTAQHREMLDQVLTFFDILPDFDLNLMTSNQSLNQLSAKIINGIDAVLKQECFDLVLVHGDTTTSTMAAIAAFQNGVKVGHVEAGLRTNNKYAPFPEEINRQLTARLADLHFAPTISAKENLIKENIMPSQIYVTGNTVVDALNIAKFKIRNGYINDSIKELESIVNLGKKIILITGHRRENFGIKFEKICKALLEVSLREDVVLLFPVHLNPNVRMIVHEILGNKPNIRLMQPLDYPSFVWLLSQSSLVISDSGGIQEEAPSFGVPVLVTREITERPEGLSTGCSLVVGTSINKIVTQANNILDKSKDVLLSDHNPYGDGTAAIKIVNKIKGYIK